MIGSDPESPTATHNQERNGCNRRQLLATGASLGSAVLAGCSVNLGRGTPEPTASPTPTATPEPTPTPTPRDPSTSSPWWMSRFDSANTGYNAEATGPSALEVAERLTFEETGASGIVIDNGTIYTQGNDLYAFYTSDLSDRWRLDRNSENEITYSPALTGSSIYFGTKDGTIHAYDASDKTRNWSQSFTRHSPKTSPRVSQDTVYICDKYRLYGFNRHTGEELFTFETDSEISSSDAIAVYADTIYLSTDNTLYALTRDGKDVKWKQAKAGVYADVPVIVDAQLWGAYQGQLRAIDLDTGKIDTRGADQQTEPPIGTESRLYYPIDFGGPRLKAIRTDGTSQVWVYPNDTDDTLKIDQLVGAGTTIFTAGRVLDSIEVHAISAEDGTHRGKLSIGPFDVDKFFAQEPAVADGKLYLPIYIIKNDNRKGHLYVIE